MSAIKPKNPLRLNLKKPWKMDPGIFATRDLHYRIQKQLNPEGPSPDAPPPPVIEDTEGRQQDEADRLRRRKGRAAAVLTNGAPGVPMTATKILLGS